jgi:hypothetical protein
MGKIARNKVHSKAIMNLKQMISNDTQDVGSYASIESGISVKPQKKY